MPYGLAQIVLLGSAVLSGAAVFVPWEHLILLSNPTAARCLSAKIILMPISVLCLLGALWALGAGEGTCRGRG